MSGFNVILPTLINKLHISASSTVWPAGAFALVTSAFLLPFGRLADMYGGYPVYLFGLAWFTIWSLVAGFSSSQLMLDVCRALQGLGPAAFLPSGVLLMANVYRPGPRKNIVFSLYGGCAPLGFFFGIFIAGLAGQYLSFSWYFFIGAILLSTTVLAAYLTVPSDIPSHRGNGVKMDWLGSLLIVTGLILVVFAITDSSGAPAGWRTPYIPSLLILGFLLLSGALYVEGWVASSPLLPFDLFAVPYIKPLFVALFFSYGVLGIFLFYATLFMQEIMHVSPLLVSAWYVPMCLGGILISILGGYFLHLIPGTILILISGLGWIITSVLFAVAPENANYWAYIFPAMICATIGIDIAFNVANIFITTNLSGKRQGLAGALINSLLYLGIAVLIGVANVVQTATAGKGVAESYRSVFWYQLGCAGTAFVVMVGWVRIKRAESQATVDEKEAAAEREQRGRSP